MDISRTTEHYKRITDEDDEEVDRRIYTGHLDQIEVYTHHSGEQRITPFLIIQVGDEDEEDDGEEYLEEIHEAIKDLKVPYFLTGVPCNIYIVAEV